MKILHLVILLIILPIISISQRAFIISGFVRDSTTSEPLIGANIWHVETKIGTTTDNFGHYSLHVFDPKNTVLNASYIGYQSKSFIIPSDSNLRRNYYLAKGISIDEIEIKANQAMNSEIEMSALTLSIDEIKKLPSLGEHDVLKAMQLMPGIQGGAEGRSSLYIRGGSPDQNLILLDGSQLYYVNHFGNFLSLFHPEIISNLKIYKGAFPAKYGGRLSSVVDLRMREGNKSEHKGNFGIGLLSSDILLEGPIFNGKTSYLISFRRFYLDLLVRPITYLATSGFSVGYQFYDFYGKISHTFNENHRMFLSFYGGEDAYTAHMNPIEDNSFKGRYQFGWGNQIATVRLNSKLSDRLIADLSLAHTRYNNKEINSHTIDRTIFKTLSQSIVYENSFKGDFNLTLNNWYEILFGAGIKNSGFQPQIFQSFKETNDTIVQNNKNQGEIKSAFDIHAYIENKITICPFIRFNLGARFSTYRVDGTNYQKFEPRLLGIIGTNKTGYLKFSYSENMQPLHLISFNNIGTPTDVWIPSTAKIPPAESQQWSVGIKKSLSPNYELQIEAYNKSLVNLIDLKEGVNYKSTEQEWDEKLELDGKGYSKGLEFLLKKTKGQTTGWIGYTLSKSYRKFNNLNGGQSYPYLYDKKHDLSVVANHQFNKKYNISFSWVFGSGYPTTLETGFYKTYNIKPPDLSKKNPFTIGNNAILYSSKNGFRMGNTHRLDIGFQIHGKTKKGNDKIWSFNIYNAYNKQNPVYYYFDWTDKKDHSKGISLWQQSGFPIIPSFTYRVKW